jgi:polysaccharide chain length determinant protein (PEP-CTERM system associated)
MNVESGIQFGELIAIARRRAKAVVGVALAVSLAGYWITMALPNEYESSATVLVEPQSVDPKLVEAGVAASDLNQRLGIMTSQILSRSRLSRIIDDLELYKSEYDRMVRQEIIDLMRSNISVEPVIPEIEAQRGRNTEHEINTFRIVFTDRDDVIAKLVAERLANDFIEEHIEARVEVSGKSLDFIQGELDRLSTEIREVEASVAKVKNDNPGRLPEDIPNNQRRLERITSDLAFAQRAYSEARSDEAFFRSQAATAASMGTSNAASPVVRLQLLETALTEFESRGFTEKHPDVIRTRTEIEATRQRVENIDPDDPSNTQANFAQHNAEAEGARASQRRAAAEEEIQRLENLAAEVQALLATTPAVAEQLDGLQRRYEHLFGSYQDFSNRRLEATVQAQLERRQLGEQFRVLEAAFEAPEPTSPNRPLLMILGVILGIAVGGAAGILLEATDGSIHNVRQLQNLVRIPVLAAIPQILLESDRRALRRRRIGTGIATIALVGFALVGGMASYVWVNGGPDWLTGESVVEEPDTVAPIAGAEG